VDNTTVDINDSSLEKRQCSGIICNGECCQQVLCYDVYCYGKGSLTCSATNIRSYLGFCSLTPHPPGNSNSFLGLQLNSLRNPL
jgi:hypothetical protein